MSSSLFLASLCRCLVVHRARALVLTAFVGERFGRALIRVLVAHFVLIGFPAFLFMLHLGMSLVVPALVDSTRL